MPQNPCDARPVRHPPKRDVEQRDLRALFGGEVGTDVVEKALWFSGGLDAEETPHASATKERLAAAHGDLKEPRTQRLRALELMKATERELEGLLEHVVRVLPVAHDPVDQLRDASRVAAEDLLLRDSIARETPRDELGIARVVRGTNRLQSGGRAGHPTP